MSYASVHWRLREKWGVARGHACVVCGNPASDWAYQYTGEVLCDDGRVYSERLEDYAPMCRSCHQRLDISKDPRVRETRQRLGRAMGLKSSVSPHTVPNRAKGTAAIRKLQQESPEFRQRQTWALVAAGQQKRACSECRMVASAGTLGRHQKCSGHRGYRVVD